jgi:lipopolysaccharide transport system ATP-binding protein
MSDTVIKIENLGKKYMLAHKQPQKYIALRDMLVDRAKRVGRRMARPFSDGAAASGTEDFWALSSVSAPTIQSQTETETHIRQR